MVVRNYTTQIKIEKTIGEIEALLVRFGAQGIYKEYGGQRISSLMFFIVKDGQKIPFKIPVSQEKSRAIINKIVSKGKLPRKFGVEPLRSDQGERVAWRIIKDWVDSQLSLLEMNFADPVEIFLPYAYNVIENKTMYDKFLEKKDEYLALEQKGD